LFHRTTNASQSKRISARVVLPADGIEMVAATNEAIGTGHRRDRVSVRRDRNHHDIAKVVRFLESAAA
jgi:hypothetical protein